MALNLKSYSKTNVNIKIIYLLIVIFYLFIIYNYTNITGNNWFIHPDDYNTWIFSKHLYETGELSIKELLNINLEYPAIRPSGGILVGDKFAPVKAVGEYYLIAVAFMLGDVGPFYLIPVIGILAVYFFFRTVENLYGINIAFMSVLFMGLSFPMVYWSNMLYSNIPAISFFIIGLYFLTKNEINKNNYSYIVLSSLFFSSAVWMRYEYFIFVLLLFPLFIPNKRIKNFFLVIIIISLLALLPIMLSNYSLFGSPFVTGYTYGTKVPEELSEDIQKKSPSISSYALVGVKKIYYRFMTQDLKPNSNRIIKNANDWIYSIFPIILPLSFLGMLHAVGTAKSRKYVISFFLISVLWSYNTLGGYHWGENTQWLGSSYIRYLLIVYAVIIIYASVFLIKFIKKLGNLTRITFISLFLIIYITGTMTMLFGSEFDLNDTSKAKNEYYRLNKAVDKLPENSIIVANLAGKYITSRKVYHTKLIKEDVDYARNRTTQDIIMFINEGFHVYLLETPYHKSTYLNMQEYLESKFNQNLEVTKVNENPDIYEVILRNI